MTITFGHFAFLLAEGIPDPILTDVIPSGDENRVPAKAGIQCFIY
jgi:hypothetical protein